MSIKVQSDIVLDVARAADPVAREAATRRLAALSGAKPDTAFQTALAEAKATPVAHAQPTLMATSTPSASKVSRALEKTSSLEGFYLRMAFDAMLPKGARLGSRVANAGADVWRSMLAETLADHVVAAGGLKTSRAEANT